MGQRKMPGLRKRGGVWHIDKQIKGYGRLYESTSTSEREEAERYLMHRLEQIREQLVYGKRPEKTWRQAATRYLLEEEHKRSIDRDAQALGLLDPYIGDLPLKNIHMDTLAQYIKDRKAAGIRSGTIRRDLATVRRILNLAAREWRNEQHQSWLDSAPYIRLPDWGDQRQSYPLTWDEQRKLFKLLPEHLHRMALFKVNTGTREQEVCKLRWNWEIEVPELETTMFLIPARAVKNKEERLVVLNRIARSVVELQRGKHSTHVFTYLDKPVGSMDNSAWRKAGLPVEADIRRGVHNLKHTCGRRLRAVGVPLETPKVLMGHTNGDITTHYSMPELTELQRAIEKIADMESGKTPAVPILRRKLSFVGG